MNSLREAALRIEAEEIRNTPPVALVKAQAERERDAITNLELYKRFQDATNTTEAARVKITKGIMGGASPYRLLLTAAEAIAKMTADPLFYDTVKRDMLLVYGEALGEPEALQVELEDVEHRLEKLTATAATMPPDDARRLSTAIREHQAMAEDLRARISI